ncbi:hypothetical protein BDV26DRAFT_197220 [Aspergillus bertholletiae]|uniref:Major facilitator superfamily (MFS) profile domain-containing protein n=1 Tax=Aspergillus bertholletiae TaxID=1226010 RepID=A0A5N7B8Q8_9EURO|nr:hypothetical protein BDV26DRAFT_197220 [Aspergillus bertholletiae]
MIFASFLTVAILFLWFMMPEELKFQEIDDVFQSRIFWGKQKSQLCYGNLAYTCSVDAERGETQRLEDLQNAGARKVKSVDASKNTGLVLCQAERRSYICSSFPFW